MHLETVDRVWFFQRSIVLHFKNTAIPSKILPVFPFYIISFSPFNFYCFREWAKELQYNIEYLQEDNKFMN